jgi:hypothetical protein
MQRTHTLEASALQACVCTTVAVSHLRELVLVLVLTTCSTCTLIKRTCSQTTLRTPTYTLHCTAYTGLLVVGGEQEGESQSAVTADETAATAQTTNSNSSNKQQQQQSTQRAPAFLGFAVNVEPLLPGM